MDRLAFLDAYLALPFEDRSQTQIIVLSGTLAEEKHRVQELGIRFESKPLRAALAQKIAAICTSRQIVTIS